MPIEIQLAPIPRTKGIPHQRQPIHFLISTSDSNVTPGTPLARLHGWEPDLVRCSTRPITNQESGGKRLQGTGKGSHHPLEAIWPIRQRNMASQRHLSRIPGFTRVRKAGSKQELKMPYRKRLRLGRERVTRYSRSRKSAVTSPPGWFR